MELNLRSSIEGSIDKSKFGCLTDVLEDASRTNSKVFIETEETCQNIIQILQKTIDEKQNEMDSLKIKKNHETSLIYQENLDLINKIHLLEDENNKIKEEFEGFKLKSAEEQEALFERIKRQQSENQNKIDALKRSFDDESGRHLKEKATMFGEYQLVISKNLDLYGKFENFKKEKEEEINQLREILEKIEKSKISEEKTEKSEKDNFINNVGSEEKIEEFVYSLEFINFLLKEYIFSGKDMSFQDVIEGKIEILKEDLLKYKLKISSKIDNVPPTNKIQKVVKFEDFDNFEQHTTTTIKVWHKSDIKFYTLKEITGEGSQSCILLWESLQKSRPPSILPEYFGVFQGHQENYYLCFNYFPSNLKLLMDYHKSQSVFIPFQKILGFAEKLINGLAFLQSLEVHFGEFLPENILLDETKENPYILDISRSEIHQMKVNEYSSPEIDDLFNEKEKKSLVFNRFKSNTFTLALILLEIGTLKELKKEKDEKTWKKKIKEMIAEFSRNYEKEEEKTLKKFVGILKKCLKFDNRKRPDFIDLFYKFQRKLFGNEESLRAQITASECHSLKMCTNY